MYILDTLKVATCVGAGTNQPTTCLKKLQARFFLKGPINQAEGPDPARKPPFAHPRCKEILICYERTGALFVVNERTIFEGALCLFVCECIFVESLLKTYTSEG